MEAVLVPLKERRRGAVNGHATWLTRQLIISTALTATPQGNRAFKRAGFTSRYIETKADGDEAEMLVREGNETFKSL